jgi:hypothetical protein
VVQEITTTSVTTYISKIHLIDKNEKCELILNYGPKEANCPNFGVNFCSYEMDGDTFTVSGVLSATYSSVIPTYIHMDDFAYNAGCYIEGFPSTILHVTKTEQTSN